MHSVNWIRPCKNPGFSTAGRPKLMVQPADMIAGLFAQTKWLVRIYGHQKEYRCSKSTFFI